MSILSTALMEKVMNIAYMNQRLLLFWVSLKIQHTQECSYGDSKRLVALAAL